MSLKALGRAFWLAIVVGCAASAAASLMVGAIDRRAFRAAFEARATESFRGIQSQMTSANDVLYALRDFIDLDELDVSRAAFQAFARRTRMRVPALRNTGYAPRVSDAERDGFEAAARATGAPGFLIREPGPAGRMVPSPRKETTYPIFFPDPVEVTPSVIGLDLSFEQGRRNAIARALASQRPAATPPIDIVTGADMRSGFMSFLPVYEAGQTAKPPKGLVYGVFEIAPMLRHILEGELRAANLDVLFFDPTRQNRTIYFYPASVRQPDLPPPSLGEIRDGPYWESTLDMGGQPWGVVFAPDVAAATLLHWPQAMTFVVGLILTAMVAGYLVVSGRRTSRLIALTTELRATAQSLGDKSERLSYLARHDQLTGLPNRRSFVERLDACLANGDQARVAVISLDLDGFKAVNDTHGHPTGDALLVSVAGRLREVVAERGYAARFGGDEFAVLVEMADGQGSIGDLCASCVKRLSEPFDIQGLAVVIGASVGVALAHDHGTTSEELITNADAALYRAKAEGRSTFRLFTPGMDLKLRQRHQLAQDIRLALRHEQFVIHYQPFVEAAGRTVTGCEALLRWRHPEKGTISPASFIPLAEETGAIRAIGAWVIEQACREAARWPDRLRVSVNLSTAQFTGHDLPWVIEEALAASGLSPARLEIEITETVLMADAEAALKTLRRIKALGVRVALDDFGTGYSSLSYLRTFPFDRIKIDRLFVRGVTAPDNRVIIEAIKAIAVGLGMSVTAEGVETDEQACLLRALGCEELQGYLFSRPMAAADVPFRTAAHDLDVPYPDRLRQAAAA